MQFLFPGFLFALAAIAIPIIIHLFHFRRFKKVYFTNVKFLKEVKEETSARSKIRNLLVLLARCLAVAFLVLAFAQPFIPQKNTTVQAGNKAVSLFIDNSFSMSSQSADVALIEKAKQRAKQIIEAYEVEDEFQILTNDFEGRHQRLVSQEDAIGLVDEIIVTPSVQEMSKVVARQRQVLNTAKANNKVSYIISDFQKNITDFQPTEDTTVAINLIPLQSVQKLNISVDSCWFEAPVQMMNQTNRLIVKVSNRSDEDREDVRLVLRLDGQEKPMGNINIPAQASAYDTINITVLRTGWHEAELAITDFPIVFDDNYSFTFNVASEIKILSINAGGSNSYINAVFRNNPYFKIDNQPSSRLDYSTLSTYQLIVMNNVNNVSTGLGSQLAQYVENGGNVLVFPGNQASIASYKNLSGQLGANEYMKYEVREREVSEINTDEFIFSDVFENKRSNLKLPKTKANYQLTRFGNRGEEVLLRYRDGGSYLGKYSKGQGSVYLCASPLDLAVNDLAQNAEIFVPMLYKMAISTGSNTQIAYTIGSDNILETENRVSNTETVYKLAGRTETFIPQQRAIGSKVILSISNEIKESGFYQLFLKEEEPLAKYAFNYNRKESTLAYYNEAELTEMGGPAFSVIESNVTTNFTDLIGERSRGLILWRWCLALVLIFLLAETLLLRFWKV